MRTFYSICDWSSLNTFYYRKSTYQNIGSFRLSRKQQNLERKLTHLRCLFKLSFRENNLWQNSQENIFFPVWEITCLIRCSLRLKALLQFASSHLNGLINNKINELITEPKNNRWLYLKPKCNFICCAKCSFRLNTYFSANKYFRVFFVKINWR